MKQVNKAILVPVLSATALLVKYVIGYEIPDAAVDLASDLIMGIIGLVGIFMNPKKQEVPQDNGSTFSGGFNK
jgi:uncharacterized membrane protein